MYSRFQVYLQFFALRYRVNIKICLEAYTDLLLLLLEVAPQLCFYLSCLFIRIGILSTTLLDLNRQQLLLDFPQKGLVRLETRLVSLSETDLLRLR